MIQTFTDWKKITIDPEFADLIAPLPDQEFLQLEANILKEGMREPLVVWKGGGDRRSILLDGHNRYKICTTNRLWRDGSVQVTLLDLPDREAAKLWIEENQAGRRNLNDDQRAMIWASILERRVKISRAQAAATAREAKADPSVAVKTAATERKPREEEKAAKESGLPLSKLRTAKKLRKKNPKSAEEVRRGKKTLRQAKREAKPVPEFLPGFEALILGDEVTIQQQTGGPQPLIYIGHVKRVTRVIHIEGSIVTFDRYTGKAKSEHYANVSILRPTTDADRQEIARMKDAAEGRRRAQAETEKKVRELLAPLPRDWDVSSYVYPDYIQLRMHVTLDQLERIVEALQPAPALAGR